MPIPVVISFTAPDPDVAPATYADSVEQLNSLVVASIDETISTFIKGIDVPAVEDQDKLWFRVNTLGNPVGWYFFTSGVWVREEPTISARFGIFTGDPTDFFDASGKGLKGPGPIALDYWGWALMNGNNQTQNWSNRFVIGGAMDDDGIVGYDGNAGGWRTNVNGEAETTGGVAEIILDADNTYNGGLTMGRYDSDPTAEDSGGGPLYGNPGGDHEIEVFTANTEPLGISVVNPFIAQAWIGFRGYID